jgi:hypothetical protein
METEKEKEKGSDNGGLDLSQGGGKRSSSTREGGRGDSWSLSVVGKIRINQSGRLRVLSPKQRH